LQQQQQLAGAESQLPAADRGVARSLARLALILGENPSDIANQLRPGDDFPPLPGAPAVGTPRDLLRNRPELVSAAAQVDAARSRRRVADRALLPTLGINANAGWQGNDISGDWESQDVWGFGGSVSVPLFAGGRNVAGIADAHAGYAAAEATARQKALLAVQEVEDALLAEAQATAEVDALSRQVSFARLAFEDARERYLGGLVNYTTVLQAIMTLQTAELNHLAARRNQLAARIQLHDALGGVWPSSLVRPAGPSL
jgi:outer membrane protein TolC